MAAASQPAQALLVHQFNTNLSDDGTQLLYPSDRPDRMQYDDPSQWPCDDFQGHWGAPGVNPMFIARGQFGVQDMPSHGHLIECFPRYAELHVGQTITVGFTQVLFHTNGKASPAQFGWFKDGNYIAHDVIWQDTGSSTPPDLEGDPVGIKMWSGTFQIEVDASFALLQHGWYDAHGEFQIVFHNGFVPYLPDSNVLLADEPIYSIGATREDETNPGPKMMVESRPFNFTPVCANDTPPDVVCGLADDRFGGQFVVLNQFMPTTVPMTRLSPFTLFTQGYGSTLPTDSEAILILDADIHHNIDGIRVVDHVQSNVGPEGNTNNVVPAALDPALMCASTPPAAYAPKHKYLAVRFQPDSGFESAGLIAFTLTADCDHLAQIVAVPDVVGSLQGAATSKLAAAGLNAHVTLIPSDSVAAGIVLTETPSAGSQVSVGSTVELRVSSTSVQHVVGSQQVPVFGLEETIDGVGDGKFSVCVKDATHCKAF